MSIIKTYHEIPILMAGRNGFIMNENRFGNMWKAAETVFKIYVIIPHDPPNAIKNTILVVLSPL